MTSFDRLHPALQHHIVNSLGWKDLRPFQEAVITPILEGNHSIVLAPTAGGKTEAAFFPLLSRMLSDGWRGLSVLYVCPIKALLNNLDARLSRYCRLVGRRSAVWHGDISSSERRKILADPPDCLLTTPESLESMLVSTRVDAPSLFASLQSAVVDEVHAFAGDDRGWHLLAVLERLSRLATREIQRIGLSATVGNPEELLVWLTGSCSRPRFCSAPAESKSHAADVQIDFVGSLANAATVVSRLHRGEKRLVFVDSRARAEQLGVLLRDAGTDCFVTHSSLSPAHRRDAEAAFATRTNCVIVATSALELGIDVGDLDRVLQIDAPSTVSSFLQRMGRTGRRNSTPRNCLFLATSDHALMQAVGIVSLWTTGFIEPVCPPALPYHIFAQQLMALALQERGIERLEWSQWVSGVASVSGMRSSDLDQIVEWMLCQQILWDDSGVLWFGEEGETSYSRRHYMELLSVFTSPPMIRVLHGRQEIGLLDQFTLMSRQDGPRVILLGGRAWTVTHVDWSRRTAQVAITDAKGRSRWLGEAQGLSFQLAQQVRTVLVTDDSLPFLSRRACDQLEAIRSCRSMKAASDCTVIDRPGSRWAWWTFGGSRANASLAGTMAACVSGSVDSDSYAVTLDGDLDAEVVGSLVNDLTAQAIESILPRIDERALKGLKFVECVPADMAANTIRARMNDEAALRHILAMPVRLESGVS
jgi:ATP-dependent helicase Lhr and Lhr-like helicase